MLAKSLGVTLHQAMKMKGSYTKSIIEKTPQTYEDNKVPILEVEINMDEKNVEKCVVDKGETCESVVEKVVVKYSLNDIEQKLVLDQLKVYFND